MECFLMKIGLSLNGGGAKGIVQLGQYKAFKDAGFDYDVLAGVSVGALNGALIHQGEVDRLEELWLNLKSKDVYRWRFKDVFRAIDDRASIYDSSPLSRILEKYVDFKKIQANPRDFWINATNLQDKDNADTAFEVKSFQWGDDLRTWLKASASPPVFFEPVRYRGIEYGDGGLVSNFNQHRLRSLGCDVIIHLYPSRDPVDTHIDNVKEALDRTVSIPSYAFLDRELDATSEINQLRSEIGKSEVLTVRIQPKDTLNIGLLDFDYCKTKYSRKELIEIGYESAYSTLDVLYKQLFPNK